MTAKRKLSIIAIIIAILAALLGIGMVVTTQIRNNKIQENLDMGAKYLDELDYDKALVAFQAVLEIEPKSMEAYLGIVEAYIGKGDYASALSWAQRGYEVTADEKLKEKVEEVEGIVNGMVKQKQPEVTPIPTITVIPEVTSTPTTEPTPIPVSTEQAPPIQYGISSIEEIPFVMSPFRDEAWDWSVWAKCYDKEYVYLEIEIGETKTCYKRILYDTYVEWTEAYKVWLLENDYNYNPFFVHAILYPQDMYDDEPEEIDGTWRFEE